MLVVNLVRLLVLFLCSVRASEEKSDALDIFKNPSVPKIELLRILDDLPDDLFKFLVEEFFIRDTPLVWVLAKTSKSIRTRMQNLRIFQIYMATKYQLPSLATLDFHPDLLTIEDLLWNGNPPYSEIWSPEILYQRLELNFEPSPLIDQVLLRLYDHFAENPPRFIYSDWEKGRKLAKYVFKLILTNRPLALYVRIKGLLSYYARHLSFINIPNISTLMADWFANEPESFNRVFFNYNFYGWSKKLFIVFINIPGAKLPTNLSIYDAENLLRDLSSWMLDPDFIDPENDQTIFNLWSDYLKDPHNFVLEFNPEFEFNLNLRFNRDYKYVQQLENIDYPRLDRVIALLVYAGKYEQAAELIVPGLQIGDFYKNCLMNRPEFCIYLNSTNPEVYRSCFDDLPGKVYEDPSRVGVVLAFHQVNSVEELFDYFADFSKRCQTYMRFPEFSKWVHLSKFVSRFGAADDKFNAQIRIFSWQGIEILTQIIQFKHQSDEFNEFIEYFIQLSSASSEMVSVLPCLIKILLRDHPEVLMKLLNCNRIKIETDFSGDFLSSPEYTDAPEEIKCKLESICSRRTG